MNGVDVITPFSGSHNHGPLRIHGFANPIGAAFIPGRRAILAPTCNDDERNVTWAQYEKALESVSVTIPSRQSEFDLRQADDVRINDIALA